MLLKEEFERTVQDDLAEAERWEKLAEQDFVPRRMLPKDIREGEIDLLAAYDEDDVLRAGMRAHAYKQAHYRRERALRNDALRARQAAEVDRFLAAYQSRILGPP